MRKQARLNKIKNTLYKVAQQNYYRDYTYTGIRKTAAYKQAAFEEFLNRRVDHMDVTDYLLLKEAGISDILGRGIEHLMLTGSKGVGHGLYNAGATGLGVIRDTGEGIGKGGYNILKGLGKALLAPFDHPKGSGEEHAGFLDREANINQLRRMIGTAGEGVVNTVAGGLDSTSKGAVNFAKSTYKGLKDALRDSFYVIKPAIKPALKPASNFASWLGTILGNSADEDSDASLPIADVVSSSESESGVPEAIAEAISSYPTYSLTEKGKFLPNDISFSPGKTHKNNSNKNGKRDKPKNK